LSLVVARWSSTHSSLPCLFSLDNNTSIFILIFWHYKNSAPYNA
jgi:hypothetical protein